MNENSDKVRYLVIMVLIFIAIAILEIFICKTAFALEIKNPDYTKNLTGQTYYGYNIPTRPTATSGNLDNSVYILDTTRRYLGTSPNPVEYYTTNYVGRYDFKVRSIDDYVKNYINDNQVEVGDIPKIWTDSYVFDKWGSEYQYSNLVFGFHPGLSSANVSEMLTNGFEIDYSQKYSYTFDIILYNVSEDSYLGQFINSRPYNHFSTNGLTSNFMVGNPFCINDSCRQSFSSNSTNGFTITKLIETNNIQYYRVKLDLTDNSINIGFTETANGSDDLNNEFGVYGNNLIVPFALGNSMIVNRFPTSSFSTDHTKVIFSQPYNIVLWSTDSSLYCQDNCWSQDDTEQYQDEPFIEKTTDLYEQFNNLDYYGFSGIVNLTFNFIKGLINDVDESCVSLDIPILSTHITLPSSCTFWGRDDISDFENFYQFLWLGLVSYVLAWKIFKDIINLYNPTSNLVSGKEVDSL